MPLSCRTLKPVLVSQIEVPKDVDDELAFVVNATLSNLIRQIANLSLKAADIFAELNNSITTFVERTTILATKVSVIVEGVDLLCNSTNTYPLLNTSLSIYKDEINRDDELLSHTQMPECIKEMFDEAQQPPELFKFDKFRRKGEESMKLYTDPDFFLREWLKNARNEREHKNEKKKKRRRIVMKVNRPAPALPPPMIVYPKVQEHTDYFFGDFMVYEDLDILKECKNPENTNETDCLRPLPPPPPIISIFPLSPAVQPQLNISGSTIKNLLTDIQKGSILKSVSQNQKFKEKTKDFRQLIQELRPAWEIISDDSSEADVSGESNDSDY